MSQKRQLFLESLPQFLLNFIRLPTLKPKQVVRVLKKLGFEEIRQTGSHLILVNRKTKKIVPVPIHSKDLKRGLLISIIKQTGLTIDEFIELL